MISANLTNGVELITGATTNLVEGNQIGTDGSGTLALANSNVGVVIYDTSANTIGGTTAITGRARQYHLWQPVQRRAHLRSTGKRQCRAGKPHRDQRLKCQRPAQCIDRRDRG